MERQREVDPLLIHDGVEVPEDSNRDTAARSDGKNSRSDEESVGPLLGLGSPLRVPECHDGTSFPQEPQGAGGQQEVLSGANIQREEDVVVGVLVTPLGFAEVAVVLVNADSPHSHTDDRRGERRVIHVPHAPLHEAHGSAAKDPCNSDYGKASHLVIVDVDLDTHGRC